MIKNKFEIVIFHTPQTKKSKSDVDWTLSKVTSAVFNYYEISDNYLKIYINNKNSNDEILNMKLFI